MVGRVELHPDRTGLSRTSDALTLAGTVEPYNPSWKSVAVSREQILGMEGQLVAVTWPHDGKVDGFYHVDGAAVKARSLRGTRALMDWQIGLTRVARGLVDFESTLIGATLTNAHGLTGSTPWRATPAGVGGLFADPEPTRLLRSSEDGTVGVWTGAATHAVWSADASAYYAAAATIRQNLAIVTGRFPTDPPGIFELANGMCRVRWIVGEVDWDQIDGTWDDMGELTWDDMAGIAGVEVATWNGTNWVGKVWNIGITPTRVAVTRNEPHVCTVRLMQERSIGRRYVDLTLRRGAQAVHVHHHGVNEARSVLRETAEAATAITGGVKASAATDGVTYVAATVHAKTDDLTQGGFTQPAATDRFTFMLGGAFTDTPEDVRDRWVSYRDESIMSVLR